MAIFPKNSHFWPWPGACQNAHILVKIAHFWQFIKKLRRNGNRSTQHLAVKIAFRASTTRRARTGMYKLYKNAKNLQLAISLLLEICWF